MSARHPLIVRVKRRRDQEPANVLCIVEDTLNDVTGGGSGADGPSKKRATLSSKETNSISGLFSALSTTAPSSGNTGTGEAAGTTTASQQCFASAHQRQLIMTRVFTASVHESKLLNDAYIHDMDVEDNTEGEESGNAVEPSSSISTTTAEGSGTYATSVQSCLWIPRGKKLHRIGDSSNAANTDAVLIVDIVQEQTRTQSAMAMSAGIAGSDATTAGSTAAAAADQEYANLPDDEGSSDAAKRSSRQTAGTPQSNVAKVKIYNPATRMMDEAVDKAWRVGDFNGIANAMQRGASVNFQRDMTLHQGHTALMAAAKHFNVRMVSRLLERGAAIDAKNSKGQTALDILRSTPVPPSKQTAYIDINVMLNKALSKQLIVPGSYGKIISEVMPANDDEYVYDIFRFQSKKRSRPSTNADANADAGIQNRNSEDRADLLSLEQNSTKPAATAAAVPIVAVGGIHIANDGHVDLVFEYDSDWSDLGEDEDPDSNDERFEGNDYPDEDEGDEDEELERNHNGEEEEEDDDRDSGDDDNGDKDHHPQKKENKSTVQFRDDGSDDDDDFEDKERQRRPAWQRHSGRAGNRVGHVSHYDVVDEYDPHQSRFPNPHVKRETKTLQQLWDESEGMDVDVDGDEEMTSALGGSSDVKQRLATMHEASGMEFASNPMEFDRSGLPKYGHDLSDDEDYDDDVSALRKARLVFESRMKQSADGEEMKPSYHARYVSDMPPRDTLAYDSEYDED